MNLSIVTATRGRPHELLTQAELLGKQLWRGDQWVVVVDNQADETRVVRSQIQAAAWGAARLELVVLGTKTKASPGPNTAKRIGCAAAAAQHIVELDDHDFILPDAISRVRQAFADGFEFVYGWCVGPRKVEPMRPYEAWGIRNHPKGNPCIGLRAYSKQLYMAVDGWPEEFPSGDYIMALRMESWIGGDPKKITCIQAPLVSRGETPDSIQVQYADLRRRKLLKSHERT